MIKVSNEEKEGISRGHMPTLKIVMERELELLTNRLIHEKTEFKFAQGAAYYSQELCKLLGIM